MTLRNWTIQFLGVILLALATWAFLNTPDRRVWQVALTGLLALTAFLIATWLINANFGGGLSRLPFVAGILALFLILLWFVDASYPANWNAATWLASAITMSRKKALAPENVIVWITNLETFVQWIVLPVLALPLVSRATGIRRRSFWRCAGLYVLAFLLGALVPHYIVHWVPKIPGFWPQMASMVIRFLVAYVLLITGWVLLGRSIQAQARG